MIAALYVETGGIYFNRPNVDPWDVSRDARNYSGPFPVVAHPPCASWSRMAGLRYWKYGYPPGEDGGCFASALESVRRWGGVLEHPEGTAAWKRYGLQRPRFGSWQSAGEAEWVTEVWQVDYGHRAKKKTWLFYVGDCPPPALRWEKRPHVAVVSGSNNRCKRPTNSGNRVWSREAKATPPEFAELLISMANSCNGRKAR